MRTLGAKTRILTRRHLLQLSALTAASMAVGCTVPLTPVAKLPNTALTPAVLPTPAPSITASTLVSPTHQASANVSRPAPYMIGATAGHEALIMNQTTKNPQLREFFQKRDVRIALSLATPRHFFKDLVFPNLTARQYSPLNSAPQYHEKLSNAYVQYNLEQAKVLLDTAGYTKTDVEGFRLWPDGSNERISFNFDVIAEKRTPSMDMAEMLVIHLAPLGIKLTYTLVDQAAYEEHCNNNEIEAALWTGDHTIVPLSSPTIFTGTDINCPWCAAWTLWRNSKGTDPNGEKPPEEHWINTIWALWDQIEVEPDTTQRDKLFLQILDIWAEELPIIGILGET